MNTYSIIRTRFVTIPEHSTETELHFKHCTLEAEVKQFDYDTDACLEAMAWLNNHTGYVVVYNRNTQREVGRLSNEPEFAKLILSSGAIMVEELS